MPAKTRVLKTAYPGCQRLFYNAGSPASKPAVPEIAKRPGFTLIELLVVVSIIGLLASVVLVAVNQARTKARNAKVASDMHQINSAMNLYSLKNNNAYPPAINSYAPTLGIIFSSDPNFLQGLVTDGEISAPLKPTEFQYMYVNYSNVGPTWFDGMGHPLLSVLQNDCGSPNARAVIYFAFNNDTPNLSAIGSGLDLNAIINPSYPVCSFAGIPNYANCYCFY